MCVCLNRSVNTLRNLLELQLISLMHRQHCFGNSAIMCRPVGLPTPNEFLCFVFNFFNLSLQYFEPSVTVQLCGWKFPLAIWWQTVYINVPTLQIYFTNNNWKYIIQPTNNPLVQRYMLYKLQWNLGGSLNTQWNI
jgi:hypothetical protein